MMQVQTLQRAVPVADLPFEKVARSPQVTEQEKIAEAGRQFEAVLLRQMLSEAQKPLLSTPPGASGGTNAIYQDLITNEMAAQISRTGSFGIAALLEQQLTSKPSAAFTGEAHEQNLPGATFGNLSLR